MSQQLELCMLDIVKTREKIRDTHEEIARIEHMFFEQVRRYDKEKDSKEQEKILDYMRDCFASFEVLNKVLNDRCNNLNDYYNKFCRLYKEYVRMG